MSFEAIVVILVIVFIIFSIYTELMGTAATFIVANITLGFFQILSPEEIISGLGNVQIGVVLMLLIIGDIIRQSSILEVGLDRLFKQSNTYNKFLAIMMTVMGAISAFLNNTPLVAIMMPYVNSWCKKHKIAPSKLLIPLSYAIILGGCITLVGTSTNLIVNGMIADQEIIPQMKPLAMFDFTLVGLPMFIIGILFIYIFRSKLLPNRHAISEIFDEHNREYLIETKVKNNSNLVGKEIHKTELHNLSDLFLVEIKRADGNLISVPGLNTQILEDDTLIFTGNTKSIANLIDTNIGLYIPSAGILTAARHTEVHEVVISHNSTLITKTIWESNFRSTYDSAVIGIHRNGERLTANITNVRLKAGDVLIIIAGPDIINRKINTLDFYFLSKIKERIKHPAYKIAILVFGLLSTIVLSAFNIVPLFLGLLTLLCILVAIRLMNPKDIPGCIDYNLGIIIAMSLGLGMAMMNTGVAQMIADFTIQAFQPFGVLSVLIGVFLVTSILGAVINNKAAIALVFPVAITIAKNLHVNPTPFALLVAFAGAANFITPYGYQTNLMVYGPGNYMFKDFLKIGIPLTAIFGSVAVSLLYLFYF